jgi:hypothetical protein
MTHVTVREDFSSIQGPGPRGSCEGRPLLKNWPRRGHQANVSNPRCGGSILI